MCAVRCRRSQRSAPGGPLRISSGLPCYNCTNTQSVIIQRAARVYLACKAHDTTQGIGTNIGSSSFFCVAWRPHRIRIQRAINCTADARRRAEDETGQTQTIPLSKASRAAIMSTHCARSSGTPSPPTAPPPLRLICQVERVIRLTLVKAPQLVTLIRRRSTSL